MTSYYDRLDYFRNYYLKNKEKKTKYQSEYYEKNREKIKIYFYNYEKGYRKRN